MLLVEGGVERPGVDADADRDAPRLCLLGHRLDVLRLADVPGVQPQAVHPGVEGGEGEAVLEVDVGDDRHGRARNDAGQSLGRLRLVAGAANDVGPGARKRVDLGERALDVGRLGDRHRLHAHRRAATDGDVADHDLRGFMPGAGAGDVVLRRYFGLVHGVSNIRFW